MLIHPTLEKLTDLKLHGMAAALADQMALPDGMALSFDERLGLMIDREVTERDARRISSRLRRARLRHDAVLEDLDRRGARGLDPALMQTLASCRWIRERLNLLITGPTGAGKTWLACAFANKACREGHSVLYLRLARLLQDLALARGDGRYAKRLAQIARVELLVLDDWGLAQFNAEARRDLLEILEDRYDRRATLATSQLPVAEWHDTIGDPTLADAILDRLVHNAYQIHLKGGSMRKHTAEQLRKPTAGA